MFFYFINKFLEQSCYSISKSYGFNHNNIGKLVKKHQNNIENYPYIFHLHKIMWKKAEIWKSSMIIENGLETIIEAKHNKLILKLEKKHRNYD
jgi:hypothetical protein